MKSRNRFLLFFMGVTSVAQLAMAKYDETTCYKLVTPSNLIVNSSVYNKRGDLNPMQSYRTQADSVLVKHIYSKDYNEDGSVSSEAQFLEIRVRSLGKTYATYRIPQMDDGSFAADEDGGSDIQLIKGEPITRLDLPRGAKIHAYKRNRFGRTSIVNSERTGRYYSLSESHEPLTLANVACSREDLK